ncbi:MAG: penicillin-binding protein [Alistipes sp.]
MLYLLFFLVALGILCRLIWVQLFCTEVSANAGRLEGRIFQEEIVTAHRGSILSRHEEPLATSIFRYRITFDFSAEGFDSLKTFNEQTDSLSKLLALYFQDRTAEEYSRFFRAEHAKHYQTTFRRDSQVYRSEGFFDRLIDRLRGQELMTIKCYDTLRDPAPVEVFPREVDYAEWQVLRKYPILNWNMGMVYHIEEIDQRIYPQGELARRTIGLIGEKGNYGIEAIYRDLLAGKDGKILRRRIARGFSGRVTGGGSVEPVDGCDIITTLDLDIQDVADKALRKQVETQNAIWGTTLVMEASTGDILAMANLGRRSNGSYAELENYALRGRMEPGSTFKLAALLALVEDQKANLSLSYNTGNGRAVMVGRAKIQDSHGGFSVVNLKTAIAQSLNVYCATAIYEAYKNDPKRYIAFLKHLHLDRPVGLEEFGEKTPIMPEPGQDIWYPGITLPNMGYGYGIELAPIQTLTLYNAVANNGVMVAPRLIREIRRNNVLIEKREPRILVDSICSPEALAKVRACLEEVAKSGTAKHFFGDTTNFCVGVKTGTAKFAQGEIHYSDGYYLGTMVAYLPADKPRYTVLTAIFTRRGNGTTYYGAGLAGPTEQQVAAYLFNREHDWYGHVEAVKEEHHPRQIKGGDATQVHRIASKFSPCIHRSAKLTGWVRAQIDSSATVSLFSLNESPTLMPDVKGMGLKDALFLLESRGLIVHITGQGAVSQQSIPAGTHIQRKMAVSITLN